MEQTTMFDNKAEQPLASRLRPERLEEFVGQKHLIGEGKVLRRLIESDHISSMIFGDRRVSARQPWRASLRTERKRPLSIFRR